MDFGPTGPSPREVFGVETRVLLLCPIRLGELAFDTEWPRLLTVEDDVDVWWRAPKSVTELLLKTKAPSPDRGAQRLAERLEVQTAPWLEDVIAKRR
jgi:hypothetical protein